MTTFTHNAITQPTANNTTVVVVNNSLPAISLSTSFSQHFNTELAQQSSINSLDSFHALCPYVALLSEASLLEKVAPTSHNNQAVAMTTDSLQAVPSTALSNVTLVNPSVSATNLTRGESFDASVLQEIAVSMSNL